MVSSGMYSGSKYGAKFRNREFYQILQIVHKSCSFFGFNTENLSGSSMTYSPEMDLKKLMLSSDEATKDYSSS